MNIRTKPSTSLPLPSTRRPLAVLAIVLLALAIVVHRRDPAQGDALLPASGAAHLYVVQPGDTLWSIAKRLQPRGDVRRAVASLRAAHGSSSVDVGDRIAVPRPLAPSDGRVAPG